MPKLKNLIALGAALGAGVAGALAAAWSASRLAWVDPRFYRTRFGLARVFTTRTPDGRPIRVLAVGGGWQTVMYADDPDTPAASYARGFDLVLNRTLVPVLAPRVLVIGGAGCAWPRHAVALDPQVQVVVAEIDPAVIDIARREFHLDDAVERAGAWIDGTARLQVEAADGLELLSRDPRSYDVIVDDAFVGREADDKILSPEGLALVKERLTLGGLFVVNVSVPTWDPTVLLDARRRLQEAFACVSVVPAIDEELAEEENYLVVGCDRHVAVPGAVEL